MAETTRAEGWNELDKENQKAIIEVESMRPHLRTHNHISDMTK